MITTRVGAGASCVSIMPIAAWPVAAMIAVLSAQPRDNTPEAISKLRQDDVKATMAFDIDALAALWSDDIVSLAPGRAPLIGKPANLENLRAMQARSRGIVALQYAQDWRGLQVHGDHAIEWGVFTSVFQLPGQAAPVTQRTNVLRVLRREAGGWKITHTIFNESGGADG